MKMIPILLKPVNVQTICRTCFRVQHEDDSNFIETSQCTSNLSNYFLGQHDDDAILLNQSIYNQLVELVSVCTSVKMMTGQEHESILLDQSMYNQLIELFPCNTRTTVVNMR